MAQFAIMRTKKLKSSGALAACEKHCERQRHTPNADPDRTKDNQVVVGQDQSVQEVFKELTKHQKVRKNAVYGVEVMMTFSPESPPRDLKAWAHDNKKWLEREFGGPKNLAKLYLHMDETTPHLHAIVIPIDPKGKLNCRHYLGGGKETMSKLQDRYAEAMKPHGLERGNKDSKAKHTEVGEFYRLIQEPLLEKLPDPKPFESTKAYRKRLEPALKQLNANFAQVKLIRKNLRSGPGVIQRAKEAAASRPKERISKKIEKAKNMPKGPEQT